MRASIRQKPKPSKGLIYPVILIGGAGTRLWPVSSAARPKPFLALLSAHSLLEETLRRLEGAPHLFAPSAFVANAAHAALLREALQGRAAAHWRMFEPVARNTAAAVALAALWAETQAPDACVLIAPADHHIARPARFHALAARAQKMAAAGDIVTFGIVPTHAHVGLGYIEAGARLAAGGRRIVRFREKPDAATAARWVAGGKHLWNSGMFLARADVLLAELAAHAPDLMACARRAFVAARRGARQIHIARAPFARAPALPFDIAVMEKSARGAVLDADIGWSDIGSWDVLWQLAGKDKQGNVCLGASAVLGGRNNYLRAEGRDNYLRAEGRGAPKVLLVGLDELAVLQHDGVTVIAPRALSAAVTQARTHWLAHAKPRRAAPSTKRRAASSAKRRR